MGLDDLDFDEIDFDCAGVLSADANPLLDDFSGYIELNPAFEPWRMDDPGTRDQRVVDDWCAIFYRNIKEQIPNEEREVERQLEIFRVAIRAKIDQLIGNEVWAERGGTTEQQFREVPRTFPKTVQEVLTHPTERMVFQREELMSKEDLQAAISSVIIDPRRITNTLLTNLGLEEFIPPKRTKREKQVEIRAQAIPAIREMLTKLEPVRRTDEAKAPDGKLKYFRMMRISEGPNEGHILGTQTINGEKIMFKTDLFGADRRLSHIDAGYEEEIRKLKWLETTLKSVHRGLNYWKAAPREEIEELRESFEKCVNSLEFVRARHKRTLREKVRKCVAFRDKRGRENPGAAMAIIASALPYIGYRLRDIEDISEHLGKDRRKVGQLIQGEAAPMNAFLNEVEKLHTKFRILKRNPTMNETEKANVIRNLNDRKEDALALKFEPHLSFGRKFAEQIDRVIQALQEDRFEDASKEFVKIYVVAKIARSHRKIQDLYERLSVHPRHTEPETLLGDIEKIERKLKFRPLKPEFDTKEYTDAYVQQYILFNSLKKKLNILLGNRPAEEKAEESPKSSARHRTTLDDIIEEASKRMPKLGRFFEKARSAIQLVEKIKRGVRDALTDARAESPKYTEAEKQKTYLRMKERINELDFAKLVRNLP